jgi:MFS family permease
MNRAPSPLYAAWALIVLFLAYVVAFMDRQVLNLVVEPIKRDIGVSDVQISLLQGLSFALFLSIAGLPIGRLIDTRRRTTILSLGILFWSVMTGAFGATRLYLVMLLARIGVGTGEATMTPTAYSLLGDYFPPQRLGLAVGLYSMGSFIGSGLALVAGGAVLTLLPAAPTILPLIGAVHGWQMLFLLLVPIGLAAALLVATLYEPPRRDDHVVPDWAAVRGYVAGHWRAVLGIDLAVGLINLAAYALMSWAPTLFVRSFGWKPGAAGLPLGLLIILCCGAGTLFAGILGDWLIRRGVARGRLRVMAGAAILGVPLAIAAPLMPTPGLVLLLLAPLLFCIAAGLGSGPASLQEITPNRLRGLQHAVAVLLANVIGLGLGPTLVALVTEHALQGPTALARSLALVVPTALAAACIVAIMTAKSYNRPIGTAP